MRIWLNPQRLAASQLMPSDVVSAIQAQNTEVAAGEVGGLPQPSEPDAQRDGHRAVASCRRPTSSAQIILKTDPSGATVRLGDVARVELGAENYSSVMPRQRPSRRGHRRLAGAGRRRAEDRRTGQAARRGSCRTNFPDGLDYAYAIDTTDFIKLSVQEVVEDAARGDRPRRPRDLRLPAELARDCWSRRSPFRSCCSARSRSSTSPASRSTR